MSDKAEKITNGVLYSYVIGIDAVQVASKAVVSGLSAAGLLVTPAMERAVEACKAAAAAGGKFRAFPDAMQECWGAGHAILAERAARRCGCNGEKPEPRWAAAPIGGKWGVLQNGTQWWTGFTESQARAVAKALNEEGGGRG